MSRVEKDGPECTARTVREDDLHAAVVKAVNTVFANRGSAIKTLKENINEVLGIEDENSIEAVDALLKAKQTELLNAGRDEARAEEIGKKIESLREKRQKLLTDSPLRADYRERIEAMLDFLNEQDGTVIEYSDALVRRLIERITVHDDKLTFEFKSGLEIDIEV